MVCGVIKITGVLAVEPESMLWSQSEGGSHMILVLAVSSVPFGTNLDKYQGPF